MKYTTDATDLPLPSDIGKDKFLIFLEAVTNVGSILPLGGICRSHFGCVEKVKKRLCRGAVQIKRTLPDEVEWNCEHCFTKGIVRNFLDTEYDLSEDAPKDANLNEVLLTLPNKEYFAISTICGLPQEAHYSVICAQDFGYGRLVQCSEAGFRELAHEIAVEVREGLCRKSDAKPLARAEERVLDAIGHYS